MIKALIVDDESKARNILRILIDKHIPTISEVQFAASGMEALEILKTFEPNLLFLDIEMPFMDGFDLLAEIDKRNFDIIFTTAYDQYAIKAIRFSALDYLLKPISHEELQLAVNRFLEKKQLKSENGKLYKNFLSNLNNINTDTPRLAITTQEGTIVFNIYEIIRCEASSNYTLFYLNNKQKFIASKTLKEYDEILSEYGFFRVHKSHLVNLGQVSKVNAQGYLELKDGSSVEVSRRKKQLLIERLKT